MPSESPYSRAAVVLFLGANLGLLRARNWIFLWQRPFLHRSLLVWALGGNSPSNSDVLQNVAAAARRDKIGVTELICRFAEVQISCVTRRIGSKMPFVGGGCGAARAVSVGTPAWDSLVGKFFICSRISRSLAVGGNLTSTL